MPGAIGERIKSLPAKTELLCGMLRLLGLAWASELYLSQDTYGAIPDRRTEPFISALIGPL